MLSKMGSAKAVFALRTKVHCVKAAGVNKNKNSLIGSSTRKIMLKLMSSRALGCEQGQPAEQLGCWGPSRRSNSRKSSAWDELNFLVLIPEQTTLKEQQQTVGGLLHCSISRGRYSRGATSGGGERANNSTTATAVSQW
jgi:hypothetical protein